MNFILSSSLLKPSRQVAKTLNLPPHYSLIKTSTLYRNAAVKWSSSYNNNIVHLNVGGTRYEVSQSLIKMYPDTMLARKIREEWRSVLNNQEIFIDRNGLRFQYVLDYMRNEKAHVADNDFKESVLKELEYFGFENVPLDSIDGQQASSKQALDHVQGNLKKLKKDWVLIKVASKLYEAQLDLKQSVTLRKDELSNDVSPTMRGKENYHVGCKEEHSETSNDSQSVWIGTPEFQSDLNLILVEYGLSVSSISVPSKSLLSFNMDMTSA
jgi:hypothetical protein